MTTETVDKPVETAIAEAPDQRAEYQELVDQLAEVERKFGEEVDHPSTDRSKAVELALESNRIKVKMKKYRNLVDEEAMDGVAQNLQAAFKKGIKIPTGWSANVKYRGEGNTIISLIPSEAIAEPVIAAIRESGLSSGFDMTLTSDGAYELNPRRAAGGGGGGGGGKGWKSPSGETVKLSNAFDQVATADQKAELEGKSNSSQWQLKKKAVEKAGYTQ